MVPINTQVEHYLRASGDIDKTGEWYAGRPIMITKNNAAMHLYNGDIGICLSDPKSDEKLMVFFPSSDGDVKKLIPTRLPHCETVFAMTIHKSQGSEFNEILIALPPTMNPVLSKELLYTAITRAREKVVMVVEKLVFEQTIQKKTERFGGLEEKIIGYQTKT
jgi:exodeoxyribonuclease V alpha subunit